MKKSFIILATIALTFTFSSIAFAGNAVSEMALAKGGQHVAQCAQEMGKGVSECAKMTICQHVME